MPTAIKIWEIVKDNQHTSLQQVADDSFAESYIEKELERWVEEDPSILGERILIVDRQRDIRGVGRLDLLGVDQNGHLVVIELKRDRSAREAVAQALDYASWLHSATETQIEEWWAEQHPQLSLRDRLRDYFDVEEGDGPDLSCERPRVLVVAPRLDASAERIISYLSQEHDVSINAVFFQYGRLSDGKEVLARDILVPEESIARRRSSKATTDGELMTQAAAHGTTGLVAICRAVNGWWSEQAASTFEGSFRYWGVSRAGQSRMVFGVNTGGKAGPPRGQLDVWIHVPKLSEVTGQPEEELRKQLGRQPVNADIHMGKNNPLWIRLKTEDEAHDLVRQLGAFAAPAAKGTAA